MSESPSSRGHDNNYALPPSLLLQNCQREQQRKAVNFSTNLKVVLIPSIIDYKSAGIVQSLWWTGADYSSFYASACSEIKLLSVFEGIDIQDAKNRLYQPSTEDLINSTQMETVPSNDSDDLFFIGLETEDNDNKMSIEEQADESQTIRFGNSFQMQVSRKQFSSDGNLAKYSVEESNPKLNSSSSRISLSTSSSLFPTSLDDALLWICVPLSDFFPTSFKERQFGRNKKRRKNQGLMKEFSFGFGIASCFAITTIVLIPLFSKYLSNI